MPTTTRTQQALFTAFFYSTLLLSLQTNRTYAQCPPNPCIPGTDYTCCNEGIVEFHLYGETGPLISITSLATEGYIDSACATQTVDTVYQGGKYQVYVRTGNPNSAQLVKIWVDFNANGYFESWELAGFSVNTKQHHFDSIWVPANAAANNWVRVRVMAMPYNSTIPWAQYPNPCDTIDFGQYEDYRIYIDSPRVPPKARFLAVPPVSCNGTIQFLDQSLYAPHTWLWDFGDGNTSTLQNPTHTYSANGLFQVKLKVWNNYGVDSATRIVIVQSGLEPAAPACEPPTVQSPCLGYGIYRVKLLSLDISSGCGDESYQDFTCADTVHIMEGRRYWMQVWGHEVYPQDWRVYIDYNQDGIFTKEELAFSGDNIYPVSLDGRADLRIWIRGGNVPLNTPLRMRIITDIGGNIWGYDTSCYTPIRGQVEDYTIVLKENPYPPVAGFYARPTHYPCYPGRVAFYDTSLNAITFWKWDFGDGTVSYQRNPIHYYTSPGTYTVTLIVCGPQGCDTLTKPNYIVIEDECPVIMSPYNKLEVNQCEGVIYDDGWRGPYFRCGHGSVLIAPPGADTIWIQFDSFALDPGSQLHIYCGTDTTAPLLGSFSGLVLPNGGNPLMCLGGAMLVHKHETNCQSGGSNQPGFRARWWSDAPAKADFVAVFDADNVRYCEDEYLFINRSLCPGNPTWYFEDGAVRYERHPYHRFYAPGGHEITTNPIPKEWLDDNDPYYTVMLVATNAYGSDTVIRLVPRFKITADFAYDPPFPSLAQGGTVHFYDLSKYWVNRWNWDFGDLFTFTDTSSLAYPSYTYDTVGTYIVRLIACNTKCCDTVWKPVRVETEPWFPLAISSTQPHTTTLHVFPQPARTSQIVTVSLPANQINLKNHSIQIYLISIHGQAIPIQPIEILQDPSTIQIRWQVPPALPTGMYQLRILTTTPTTTTQQQQQPAYQTWTTYLPVLAR